MQNKINPIAEFLVKTKSLQNLQKKKPFNSIKCFMNMQFKSDVATKRFGIQQVNSFRGDWDTLKYASSFNEPPLFSKNDSRSYGG